MCVLLSDEDDDVQKVLDVVEDDGERTRARSGAGGYHIHMFLFFILLTSDIMTLTYFVAVRILQCPAPI